MRRGVHDRGPLRQSRLRRGCILQPQPPRGHPHRALCAEEVRDRGASPGPYAGGCCTSGQVEPAAARDADVACCGERGVLARGGADQGCRRGDHGASWSSGFRTGGLRTAGRGDRLRAVARAAVRAGPQAARWTSGAGVRQEARAGGDAANTARRLCGGSGILQQVKAQRPKLGDLRGVPSTARRRRGLQPAPAVLLRPAALPGPAAGRRWHARPRRHSREQPERRGWPTGLRGGGPAARWWRAPLGALLALAGPHSAQRSRAAVRTGGGSR
mmetsp:Transcript_103559/g.322683  ORF Transcript_103559/g.322683 Transcript_103559/m.322683 type:complete len:272 (-) Transcript_103559:208-1023(-)